MLVNGDGIAMGEGVECDKDAAGSCEDVKIMLADGERLELSAGASDVEVDI